MEGLWNYCYGGIEYDSIYEGFNRWYSGSYTGYKKPQEEISPVVLFKVWSPNKGFSE